LKLARLALTAPALLAATACGTTIGPGASAGAATPAETVQVRLPDPGNSGVLAVAKKDGSLDRALAAVHAQVAWTNVPAAFADSAQALNSGQLDVAQGTIADGLGVLGKRPGFTLFGVSQPDLMGEGVLVKNNSRLRTVKDLAGRKVAVDHGGTGEYLLLKALAKNGVPVDAVERVYLDTEHAFQAFKSGEVDGWAVYGAPVAPALTQANAHFVASGRGVSSDNYRIWAVRSALAEQHPEVVKALYGYLHEAGTKAQGEPAAYLNVFTDSGPQAVAADQRDLLVDFGKGAAPVQPITDADTVRLEKVAQLFAQQRVTDGTVDVRAHLLNVDTLPERAK